MDIEKQIDKTPEKIDKISKKKRLYISWLLTTLQFIAMTLQIIKYGTSGKAMVSGWSKTIQIIFCGFMNLYLKCSSYYLEDIFICYTLIVKTILKVLHFNI